MTKSDLYQFTELNSECILDCDDFNMKTKLYAHNKFQGKPHEERIRCGDSEICRGKTN